MQRQQNLPSYTSTEPGHKNVLNQMSQGSSNFSIIEIAWDDGMVFSVWVVRNPRLKEPGLAQECGEH